MGDTPPPDFVDPACRVSVDASGFCPVGAAQFGGVSVSLGVHALTVGVTGGLIIGMITRTARGHTGREMKASLSK